MNTEDSKSKSSNLLIFHDIEVKKKDIREYESVDNLLVPEVHAC